MKQALTCPFAIKMESVLWDTVKQVLSVDDVESTIIVEAEDNKYLVEIPKVLFSAIYKSGEMNVIDSDLGFEELY